MIETQAMKYVQAIAPAVIKDAASFTATEIDTLGFDYLTLVFLFGATDIAMAALKVQESDVSGSGYADIDGADFTAALPAADADGKNAGVHINLQNRKRYIKVVATAGDGAAGTYMAALGILSRPHTVPSTAEGRGMAAGELIVVS